MSPLMDAQASAMPTDGLFAGSHVAVAEASFAAPLLWRTDAVGALVAGDAAWAAFAGLAADFMAGMGWLDVVHPDDRAATQAAWEHGALTNLPFEIEQRLIGSDGLPRPFLTQAQPELDSTGTLVGWQCVSMDISRVHAHTSHIMEAFAESVIVYDRTGRIVQTNATARDLFAQVAMPTYTELELTERTGLGIWRTATGTHLTPEEAPSYRIMQGEVLHGAQVLDVFATTHDGRELAISFSGAPLRDAQGRITGAVVIGRDVTDRFQLERRTHEALEALLEMAEALVQAATTEQIAQQLAELTRSVLGCRRVALSVVGPDGDLVLPYAVVGLTPEQTEQWWANQRAQAVRLSDPGQTSALARMRAGEILHIDMTQPPYHERPNPLNVHDVLIVPLLVSDQLIGWLALDHGEIAHTFTLEERRLAGAVGRLLALVIAHERLRQERETARAEMLALAETNRRMHEFLSVASHELRTPLTAIRANVQISTKWLSEYLLEHDPQDANPRRARDLLLRADQNIQRLNNLVSDLLDVTRIQQGRLALRRVPADLAQIVREAVAEQRMAHPDRTITLKLGAESVPVVADPLRIGQVVTNFLTNALKYSLAEQPVTVRVRPLEGVARVDVQDRGQGLPRSEHTRVWQPFYRAPGVVVLQDSEVGLGLGLAICKSIIERHMGRVGVTSTPKRGATFWFQLPLADATASPKKRKGK